jgi:hypothetical protein
MKQTLMPTVPPDGIVIPPEHPGIRKNLLNLTLHALGASANVAERPAAVRTIPRWKRSQIAAVAEESRPVVMIDERDIAARALHHRSALTTNHNGCHPSSIQQKDRLFLRRQRLREKCFQGSTDE